MKKNYVFLAATAVLITFSCQKEENVIVSSEPAISQSVGVLTKGVGEKTPTTFVYVETNDVNPLNAMDYWLNDGTTFFDYVCFFSANIHATTVSSGVTQPTIYLNPELTP
ncbi:MAG: glycosyl hydrolase family 18, partial [Bacteroidales bacterium]|nr:glycosyl hydrolase family 18 [Bacteroidales bacterium]